MSLQSNYNTFWSKVVTVHVRAGTQLHHYFNNIMSQSQVYHKDHKIVVQHYLYCGFILLCDTHILVNYQQVYVNIVQPAPLNTLTSPSHWMVQS